MRITRRSLFRASAGAAAGIAVNACAGGDPYSPEKPAVPGAEKWRRFQESSVATSCRQCGAACGVRVRVVEGRAVRIDGDTENPINRGGIGPRGIAGLQVLYDPDRIRQPLARRDGKLEPISWEDAIAMLAERLADLRDAGHGDRLLVLCGRERGMVRELWERFARAYGTPNFFDAALRTGGGLRLANELMQGHRDLPAYDWGQARLLLSIGSGLLESSCQSVYLARLTSHLRRGRPGERARVVHVEPSFSRTAANADAWVSIHPGTQAAFALGLAHVLVREGIYDRDFVETHTAGFSRWTDDEGVEHAGFSEHLLAHYAPARVARICGVTVERIESLARQLAESQPSLALIDAETTLAPGGLQSAMAVLALNALLGAIQRPGGVVEQAVAPMTPWPDVELDDAALASLARSPLVERTAFGALPLARIPAALAGATPAPIDTALIDYANPAYAWPDPERWRQALAEIPFVVSFSPFLDETTASVAHLVLPDSTYLERFEDAQPAPSIGTAVLGVRQPVVDPLHDTKSTADVLFELAREIGDTTGAAFPWKEFRFAFAQRVAGIQEAERGSIVAATPQAFFRELFARGFWVDDPDDGSARPPRFATPSGKFEFASSRLRLGLERLAGERGMAVDVLLRQLGYPETLDEASQPHHRADADDTTNDSLILEAFKPGTYAEGSGANLPLLQELVTEPGAKPWTTEASVAPETAARLGLDDGAPIEVEGPTGSITLPLRIARGVRPGVVRIPRGSGHAEFGRFARGRGANPMRLVPIIDDVVAGFPVVHGTRVRIRRSRA